MSESILFKNGGGIEESIVKRFAFVKPGMKVIWQAHTGEYIATYEGKIDEVFLDEKQHYITVLDCYSPNPKRVALDSPTLKFF